MHQNLIFALHGFLGTGQDWQQCQLALSSIAQKNINWLTPDLFAPSSLSIKSYDKYVNEFIAKHQGQLIVTGKKIFVGYSLGGRLGLHILKSYSNFFDEFVFLSSHPGLVSQLEKEDRLISDFKWSAIVGLQPWDSFLRQWNAQAVFQKGKHEPERHANQYDLNKLADALNLWSLGHQDDLRQVIKANQNKITWVVGEDDFKFRSLAEDLYKEKILLGYNRISSSHRILFDNPLALAQLLHQLF